MLQASSRAGQSCRAPRSNHTPAPCIRSIPGPMRGARCQAASSDPYEVLGLKPDADTVAVTKAYNLLKSRHRGNLRELEKVEAAQSALMMRAFKARQEGKGVAKEIKYADSEQLFPWRPKRWDAQPKMVMIFGAIQLALMAFAFQAPSVSKAMGCMLIGIAGNVMKQNAIYPPPTDLDREPTEEESSRAGRNFLRGAGLGLLATALGLLLFSAPEYISQIFKVVVPVTPGAIVALKVAGSAFANWVMTSFYY